MTDMRISTRELCDLTAITYRQADYWTRQGYLRAWPAGSGVRRFHPISELRVADALRQVLGAGCRAGYVVAETIRRLPLGWAEPVLLDADGYQVADLEDARYVVQPLTELAAA